jgi:hypothetical protein
MSLILDRYPLDYRAEVVDLVLDTTAGGTSMCLVGLAGAGKSNLITFMKQEEVLRFYTQDSAAPDGAENLNVCAISCLQVAHAQGRFYAALLDGLRPVAEKVGYALPPRAPESNYFEVRDAVRHLCLRGGQRIIYFFDEFESLIQHQPLDLFEELRTIRDEVRTPPRFAYVFVTHRLPHRVVGNQPFENSSLYRLICDNLVAFGPYRPQDAEAMLDAITRRERLAIAPVDRERILMMSGGHAGIMYALVMAVKPQFNLPVRRLRELAAVPGPVQKACAHIWRFLHSSERAALLGLVRGDMPAPWLREFLYKRGLINSLQTPEIFSPVFKEFVAGHDHAGL